MYPLRRVNVCLNLWAVGPSLTMASHIDIHYLLYIYTIGDCYAGGEMGQ